VRVVDELGKQLGVMPTGTAMDLAEERGLDLVEVAPAATPPVCRLMDYGKFRYEATRRERDARKINKTRASNELREVRFKTRIGAHDREAKTRLVRRLLGEGSRVKVSVMFRGREITHPEVGMAVLKLVAEDLMDDANVEKTPSLEGRFLTMILTPAAARRDGAKVRTAEKEPEGAKA
jgi:translation initiation factor IF-3